MFGHSIHPQPNPELPVLGLGRVTVSVRMLAQPSMVGIAFPGTEPGWGQQPGSEDGVGTLGCQAGLGSTRGVPNSFWLLPVFVGALSCHSVPSLGQETSLSPMCQSTGVTQPLPVDVFSTLCPICSLPALGSPSSRGVPPSPGKMQQHPLAASGPCHEGPGLEQQQWGAGRKEARQEHFTSFTSRER